jgi:VanZ family protein
VLHLFPALLSVVVVLYLGTAPRGELTPSISGGDKLGHLLAFALVERTYARAFEFFLGAKSFKRAHMWGVIAAVAWGAILEIVQSFLPYRSAEFGDLFADALGALLAGWGSVWWRSRGARHDDSTHRLQ